MTSNGHVYIEIQKGMYGLPQAGILAQELLEKQLNKHGYSQIKVVPGLWTHKTHLISFTLVVDDFGVKYVGKNMQCIWLVFSSNTMKYLKTGLAASILESPLTETMPTEESTFQCQAISERPCNNLDTSVRGNFKNLPHSHVKPTYGANAQYVEQEDPSIPLDKEGQK